MLGLRPWNTYTFTAKQPVTEESKPIQVTWSTVMTYVGYAGSKIWLTLGIILTITVTALIIMSTPVLTAVWFGSVAQVRVNFVTHAFSRSRMAQVRDIRSGWPVSVFSKSQLIYTVVLF